MDQFGLAVGRIVFFFGIFLSSLKAFSPGDTLPTEPILPDFGHALITGIGFSGGSSLRVAPGEDYLLVPGDQLTVQILGGAPVVFQLKVGEDGSVSPERMSRMYLAGLALSQARRLLESRLARFYRFGAGQCLITVIPAGQIRVYVLGKVQREGYYEMPAGTQLFQAISRAGGPLPGASVRQIRVFRGEIMEEMDAYNFMTSPDGTLPPLLSDNTLIHIPAAAVRVAITGAVHRPAFLEVKEGDCLDNMLAFAGGLLPSADRQFAHLFRYAGSLRNREDVPLAAYLSGISCFDFHDGDSLVFRTVRDFSGQQVKISGAVVFPGTYGLDSIGTFDGLMAKAVWGDRAVREYFHLLRRDGQFAAMLTRIPLQGAGSSPAFVLKPYDEVIIDFGEKFREEFPIEVSGKVNAPFVRYFPPGSHLRLSEAIRLAGGLSLAASGMGYIFRSPPEAVRSPAYLAIDAILALQQPYSESDPWLQGGDHLYLPDRAHLAATTFAGIYGEVKNPHEYRYHQTLNLRDLLILAGGTLPGADLDSIDLFRREESGSSVFLRQKTVGVDSAFLTGGIPLPIGPGDRVVVRRKKGFGAELRVHLRGRGIREGLFLLANDHPFLSGLLRNSGSFPISSQDRLYGWISRAAESGFRQRFDLKGALDHPGNWIYDPLLQDLDTVFLAEVPNTVTLRYPARKGWADSLMVREVLTFQGERGARWYLKHFAGSILPRFSGGRIGITRLNGRDLSIPVRGLGPWSSSVMPGDTLTLMPPTDRERRSRVPLDVGRIMDRILAVTTTLSLFLVYLNR